jgi:hypothetical protein
MSKPEKDQSSEPQKDEPKVPITPDPELASTAHKGVEPDPKLRSITVFENTEKKVDKSKKG